MHPYKNPNSKYCGLLLGTLALLLADQGFAGLPCVAKAELPLLSGNVVSVLNEAELQNAIQNAQDNQIILIKPGTYNLSRTIYVQRDNVTISGDGNFCDEVILRGKGMENAQYGSVPHGIWANAQDLTVRNLTIKDVYFHGIIINPGAIRPTIESVQILNTGEQFIKSNASGYGAGVDAGKVRNSRLAYEQSPPTTDHGGGGTGYTNGVDVHGGDGWIIEKNVFENFHTPDIADNLWNPAILMWNGSQNTVVDGNVFINVDRAIAFGLLDRSGLSDHYGGIIRNNMITYTSGLYTDWRRTQSDAAILVWNSPETVVAHNTILTNGNLNKSIEFRFNTSGAKAINNLSDVQIGARNSATYYQSSNFYTANTTMFVDVGSGNLRTLPTATQILDKTSNTPEAIYDIDGNRRSGVNQVDIGAFELTQSSPPSPPRDIRGEAQ